MSVNIPKIPAPQPRSNTLDEAQLIVSLFSVKYSIKSLVHSHIFNPPEINSKYQFDLFVNNFC